MVANKEKHLNVIVGYVRVPEALGSPLTFSV